MRLSRAKLLLLSLLLAGAVVRMAYWFDVQTSPLALNTSMNPSADNTAFAQWSERIVQGDLLDRGLYHPHFPWMERMGSAQFWSEVWGSRATFHQAPLYAYFCAVLRWLSGGWGLLYAVQLILDWLAMALIAQVTAVMFGQPAGFFALALGMLAGPNLFYAGQAGREALILFAHALTLWWLVRQKRATGLAIGLWSGLLFLLKSTLLLNGFLLAARHLRQRRAFLFCALGFVLVLAPAIYRNAVVDAPLLSFDTRGKEAILLGHHPGSHPYRLTFPDNYQDIIAGSPSMIDVLLRSAGNGSVRDYLRLQGEKVLALLHPFEVPDNFSIFFAEDHAPVLAWLPDYSLLFILGSWGWGLLLFRRRGQAGTLPGDLLWLLAWAALTSGSLLLTTVLSRYRQPLVLGMAIGAGYGLAALWEKTSAGQWKVAVRWSGAGLLLSLLCLPSLQVLKYDAFRPNEYLLAWQAMKSDHSAEGLAQQERTLRALFRRPELASFPKAEELARLALADVLAQQKRWSAIPSLLAYPFSDAHRSSAYALRLQVGMATTPGDPLLHDLARLAHPSH